MKSCHGLVFKIVTPYLKQHQVPVEDLLMAGLTGVQMGVQKFDPERGNRLSTMVYMWTFSQVQATFREMAAGIHISAKARADVSRIAHAQQIMLLQCLVNAWCIHTMLHVTLCACVCTITSMICILCKVDESLVNIFQ